MYPQANALNLFTVVLIALHALRPAQPSRAAQVVARFAAPAALTAVGGIAWAVTQHT